MVRVGEEDDFFFTRVKMKNAGERIWRAYLFWRVPPSPPRLTKAHEDEKEMPFDANAMTPTR